MVNEIDVNGEVDDSVDVNTEVNDEVDFDEVSDDDMNAVVDDENSLDELTVDEVIISVIVDEVGTLKNIDFNFQTFFWKPI